MKKKTAAPKPRRTLEQRETALKNQLVKIELQRSIRESRDKLKALRKT